MVMIEEPRTREASLSAHEINRRVRQIERMKDWVAYDGGITPTMTAGNTDPSSERPQVKPVILRPSAGALTGAAKGQLVTPRGRQMTAKPWLVSAACNLGLHRGPWAYVAEGNCSQGRECGRCKSVHACTKHHHEWWYMGERTCNQLHSCTRCKVANNERTSHVWSEPWRDEGRWWEIRKQRHRCLRCAMVEEFEDPD